MKKTSILLAVLALCLLLPACSAEKSGKLFTTQYDVVDYCEDAIIVGKSDGKVYGLLDNKGKEILPLNYDDLDFLNKDAYIEGTDDTLYLRAEYEGEYTVFNTKGKQVMTSPESICAERYIIPSADPDKGPFFEEHADKSYRIYNKVGELIGECAERGWAGSPYYISDRVYCTIDRVNREVATFDYAGNLIASLSEDGFDKVETENGLIVYTGEVKSLYVIDNLKKYVIDADGNITFVKRLDSWTDYMDDEKAERESNNNKKPYNLYQSNSTWKLEDLNGQPLYVERYFEQLNPPGENDCIALTNEDDQLCIFSRNGVKLVDFGVLEYHEKDEEVLLTIDEEAFEVTAIHEGKNSVLIPIKGEEGNILYCYGGK